MIHTIEITADLTHEALLKLFRKKLMTGGSVIRLRKGLSNEERQQIFTTFAMNARPHNAAELVLRALAASEELDFQMANQLHALDLPGVQRELSLRMPIVQQPEKNSGGAC